jgi:hypothetical protein
LCHGSDSTGLAYKTQHLMKKLQVKKHKFKHFQAEASNSLEKTELLKSKTVFFAYKDPEPLTQLHPDWVYYSRSPSGYS